MAKYDIVIPFDMQIKGRVVGFEGMGFLVRLMELADAGVLTNDPVRWGTNCGTNARKWSRLRDLLAKHELIKIVDGLIYIQGGRK